MLRKSLYLPIVALIFALTACFGGGHYAPVVERQERPKVIPASHVVSRGETLYSIAWRYNKDFRQLASTNGIGAPYTIYPGQRLRIKSSSPQISRVARTVTSGSGSASAVSSNKSSETTKNSNTMTSTSDAFDWDKNRYPFRWQWPAKGHLITPYRSGSAVHKGIDIQGKLGEPVYAANSGKVVYAGSGLVGYGKLLIIKHDEQYLSAYGHNRRLLVNEGDVIRVGQKIAEFGDSGTDRVKLHFEVRRNGKPINPLNVLPRG